MNDPYERQAMTDLALWRHALQKPPGLFDRTAKGLQSRINRAIPEKVHALVTGAIEWMTRAILTGSDYAAPPPLVGASLAEREAKVKEALGVYRATAAAEGGIAGAGGFLLAAADFPVLMGLKIKALFDIAALYGHSTDDLSERLYILHIFQLAFSSATRRGDIYLAMESWDAHPHPASLEDFDWRGFQQEYRDYIDLAKLAQLLPVVGAPVGAVVNYRLLDKLGETATSAYRTRWFAAEQA